MTQLTYKAPRTLSRFLDSDSFVRCIVGPVGSGKSSVCVMEILLRAKNQAPGSDGVRRTRFAIIRNTYSQLRDTTRKTFVAWVPQEWGRWHEQSFTFHIQRPLKDGTSIDCEILFRSLNRPEDVRKLLSLELTGAYINEAREIPKQVLDVLETRVGRYPSMAQGGASWSGIWMDTNPWAKGHWGYRLFTQRIGLTPEDAKRYALFEQPGGLDEGAENIENLLGGREYYLRMMAGKDAEWIESYIHGRYPSNDTGAIFGRALAALELRKGLEAFEHPNDGVFTSWDLGVSDSTAIWFWRLNAKRMPDLIDHYESSGQSASHYFALVESKPYKYVKHYLPHDARQRSWQTGVGVVDQFIARWGANLVTIGPELSLRDGIQAGRWLLEQEMRIHPRCGSGIDALREYRYEYDEELKVFSTRPLHNWASHSADAFRYLAQVVRHTDLVTRQKVAQPLVHQRPSMDELWKEHDRQRRRMA